MKKIIHVIICLNEDGAELMLLRLINSSKQQFNYEHEVISLTTVGPIGLKLKTLGVKIYALNMHTIFQTPWIIYRLVHIFKISRPDIIQSWMYHADLLGGLAARFANCQNVIWGIRTTDIKTSRFNMTIVVRMLCAWLSSWVPKTIVCAASASRDAHLAVGYAAEKLVVIPNGFDIAKLVSTSGQRDFLRSELGIGVNEIVIGVLGRFHTIKGQDIFVRSAGIVIKHFPSVRFLMIGRGCEWENPTLSSWINDTGVADRFVLLGARSDVPVCLSAMDIFCQPSRTEGFPNAVAEAMALGLPCVVTDVGDARMLVSDTGVVVPSENPVALANGLIQMLHMQPSQRTDLGTKARNRIIAEFNIEHVRQRFEDVYYGILFHENGKL